MTIDHDSYEKIICYKAITDAVYLSSIADYVKPGYFNDKNIAKYFEIVSEFYDNRHKLPNFTEIKAYLTTDELRRGFKRLVESFKELDIDLDRDELYTNTEIFLKEKAVYHTMLEVAGEISEGKVDPSDILDKFETSCNINLLTDHGFELYSGVDRLVDDILNVESSIPSNWPWFDEATDGGFREDGKAMYVFAGQANVGKSIFLGNIASNIAKQNKTVLVISLEMSEMLYAKRIASNITKIPMRDFKMEANSLRESLKDEKKKLPDSKIFIKEFPPSTITPKQISAFIKKLIDTGEKIDAIVIDYVSLLHSPVGTNSYERVKYLCEQVRALSYIYKCPLITAVQLNRSAYNESNPGMEGIAESIGVAATADVICSIFQNEEDTELGIIRLGMMKNRFGPRGMVQTMKIDYSTLSIYQTDESEELMPDDELATLEKWAN